MRSFVVVRPCVSLCDLAGANSVSAGSSLAPNEKYEYKLLIGKWSMVAEDQQIGDLIFTSI